MAGCYDIYLTVPKFRNERNYWLLKGIRTGKGQGGEGRGLVCFKKDTSIRSECLRLSVSSFCILLFVAEKGGGERGLVCFEKMFLFGLNVCVSLFRSFSYSFIVEEGVLDRQPKG